jgi:ABC-2 type transport system permease protein
MPRYQVEAVSPDAAGLDQQRLALSDRLRSHDLFAFLEIRPEALHPAPNAKSAGVAYYSSSGAFDELEAWLGQPVNEGLRRVRLAEAGVAPNRFTEVLANVSLENMTLVSRDPQTGAIAAPHKKDQAASFAIPYAMAFLLFMIVMIGSVTMLPAVAEDKMQRVFEMLLVSATPLELMAGKALAAVFRSLTTTLFYSIGGILALEGLSMVGLIPFGLLPWFLIYIVAEVTIIASAAIAMGAACGSPQDAQSLNQVLILPLVIPLIMITPVLQQPNGTMATVLSLFPPFTPLLMMLRQATPGGVPAWQPWVGLVGVLLCAAAVTWGASRIFRIAVLFQGSAPKLPELLRWAVRG